MILDAIIILLIIIGLVYYIKKGKDPKKKKKRSPIGCLVMIVLFIIVGVFGARMMGNMYDEAEKKGNKILEIPYLHPVDLEGNSKSFPNIGKFMQFGFFYFVRIIQLLIKKWEVKY